jgi:hypothetical protein
MRTSLNEMQEIEDHLFQKLNGEDEFLFRANLLLNKGLTENVECQRKAYRLVHVYGRKQLKQEIEAVHQNLFTQPEHLSFRKKIFALFGSL